MLRLERRIKGFHQPYAGLGKLHGLAVVAVDEEVGIGGMLQKQIAGGSTVRVIQNSKHLRNYLGKVRLSVFVQWDRAVVEEDLLVENLGPIHSKFLEQKPEIRQTDDVPLPFELAAQVVAELREVIGVFVWAYNLEDQMWVEQEAHGRYVVQVILHVEKYVLIAKEVFIEVYEAVACWIARKKRHESSVAVDGREEFAYAIILLFV
ncbi:hypothetical protein B0H14DRAFT_2564304 [Mycena olivaceomarginata]|nr:hypothetical protein B0H14DRAFT_2564304 [Mycena olivaceomarginata]